tara:strand:+ start:139 stop:744 length:606 start_codon:yes stop_codon:yes gene_type:complete
MRSVHDYIVVPFGQRYDNSIDVGEKELILNSSVEDHKFINRKGIVLSTPTSIQTDIEEGDQVIIHHNVFRSYYNQHGKKVDSSKLLNDNQFFCQPDQIYLYKKVVKWNTVGKRCFVKPIENSDDLRDKKTLNNVGIIKYNNKWLESQGINEGDHVAFKNNREFEFIVDNELLYCLHIDDILIKYEYKGHEKEYNPSWAKSS